MEPFWREEKVMRSGFKENIQWLTLISVAGINGYYFFESSPHSRSGHHGGTNRFVCLDGRIAGRNHNRRRHCPGFNGKIQGTGR